MKILVRLPNWLGDMVMSVGLIQELKNFYPEAAISVIAKKGIHELLEFFPPLERQFIFSKQESRGLNGLVKFGREIRKQERFDLFFCLPDSISAALMGASTGAQKRIGYRKELRQVMLTHAYVKPQGLHRAEEYVRLLELFAKKKAGPVRIALQHQQVKENYVVVNINSEASSRRLTVDKAEELLRSMRAATDEKIIMVGAPREQEFVSAVLSRLQGENGIENYAGRTSLIQLSKLIAGARVMLTTDSGPAHLANALGTHTVVLFGAGRESNTAPYNRDLRSIIRLGELACEPCEKNVCLRFETPQCLVRLDSKHIVETVKSNLSHGKSPV